MELKYYQCEICEKRVFSKEELRKENWLEMGGGMLGGIMVWLDKPRCRGGGYIHRVGLTSREYHFCSIDCLIKALKAKKSI